MAAFIGKVIEFPRRPENGTHTARVRDDLSDYSSYSNHLIDTDRLYSDTEFISPELRQALRLLKITTKLLQQATTALNDGDQIAADDCMQRVQAHLPELFSYRSLGDGFGIVVNSVQCAFRNAHGTPFDRNQISVLLRVLETIHSKPFLTSESAVDQVMLLEEQQLNPEPPAFDYLIDWLDG